MPNNIPANPFDDPIVPPDPFADDAQAIPPNPFGEEDNTIPSAPSVETRQEPVMQQRQQPAQYNEAPADPFATSTQPQYDAVVQPQPQSVQQQSAVMRQPQPQVNSQQVQYAQQQYDADDDLFAGLNPGTFSHMVKENEEQPYDDGYYGGQQYGNDVPMNGEYYDDAYDDGYGYDDGYQYSDDYYDEEEETYAPQAPTPRGNNSPVPPTEAPTVSWLLKTYGGMLDDNEFFKMQSMVEPEWDYTLEHEDGIGTSGGGFLKGKKNTLSQVDPDALANSSYIAEMEEQNGYYSPPNKAKIIACQSCKGGSGKTTASVMLATQLNWFFNPDLMQRLTTAMNARVLILSVNEFDDIPTHGIGYDRPTSEESENDGKHIAELLNRIDETNGDPVWDDISHCFVSTEKNRVFYLPSLTQREMLSGGHDLTADDYKKVFDICTRFFQFIIVDCPDIFYQERHDIMNFVFSVADVIVMIVEPDSRSTLNLFHFFDGLKTSTNKMPLDPGKCMLLVNKYVEKGNPYMPVPPYGQSSYETICKSLEKYFARFVALPYTRPCAIGNVLNGTDPKIKYAAAEFADYVLELIDENDAKDKKKHR